MSILTSSDIWREVQPQDGDFVSRGGRQIVRPPALQRLSATVAEHPEVWADYVRFDLGHRYYARLHRDAGFEVWLICWEIGQDTLMHDHGGAVGAFAVAQGALIEDYGDRHAHQIDFRVHQAGASTPFDETYVHNLTNYGLEQTVSVHAYSEPLTTMNFYCWLGNELRFLRRIVHESPEPNVTALERLAVSLTEGAVTTEGAALAQETAQAASVLAVAATADTDVMAQHQALTGTSAA